MNKSLRLVLGLVGLLVMAGLGGLGAFSLMNSVETYRSPLHNSPPQPGEAIGKPITRKVVIVLVDALRLDTSLNKSLMPFLNELRTKGASASMHSWPPSFSEPGYATILTGAWPELNDAPAVNADYADIPTFTQDDIFSAAHRAGLRTAVSGYYWFEKLIPQAAVDSSFYTSGEDAAADQAVMDSALPWLSTDLQLVLIHLDQVDFAGHHLGGPISINWDIAASQVDKYLRAIAQRLDLEKDTLIVLSDHGQINPGGHGGPEPVTLLEPFIMVGAGVIPGKYGDIQQTDVAPTLAALLGTNIPATSQGWAQRSMLRLPESSADKLTSAEYSQKYTLYNSYTKAIKSFPGQPPDPSNVLSYTIGMSNATQKKLLLERIWRIPLALLFASLPPIYLVRRKKVHHIWLVVGGLLYCFIFNFIYVIIKGKTYSLSSITSQADFFLLIGITAAVALMVAWLVTIARLDVVKTRPIRAAQTCTNLIHILIYLLVLPVLASWAWNGWGAGWTLPEFYTIFVALLSLIQISFVSIFGMLLIGATALASRLFSHSHFHLSEQPTNAFKRTEIP